MKKEKMDAVAQIVSSIIEKRGEADPYFEIQLKNDGTVTLIDLDEDGEEVKCTLENLMLYISECFEKG